MKTTSSLIVYDGTRTSEFCEKKRRMENKMYFKVVRDEAAKKKMELNPGRHGK
jgi:hypothetical protein